MFFFVSYGTLFVSLVPRERYVEANSLLNGTRALSFVAGPSIGGVLVQIADARRSRWSWTRVVRRSRRSRSPGSGPRSRRPRLRSAVISSPGSVTSSARRPCALRSGATATINFFNFLFFALFVLYATRYLHVKPGLLGVVLGAGAVGGLIGAVLTGRIVRRVGVGPAFVVGCVVFPAPLAARAARGRRPTEMVRPRAASFLAEFGSGFGVMMLDISGGAISAALVPDRLRARVSGAYMVVNYGVRPVGAFLGGVLGSTIGVRETLWIASIGALAGFVWLLPSPIPALHELPEADL